MTTPSAQSPPSSSIRLHITPLDPDLLTVVLSSTLLPKATNISYHALETFPEKRYGFLNLPADDAEKLRKRLNGAVVKGHKLRVQTAREEKLPTALGDDAMGGKSKTKEKGEEGVKKRKRDDHAVVLEGVQLEEGRKVKRGWTAVAGEEAQDKDRRARKEKGGEKKDKKEKKARRQEKSKFTEHEECLVKTVLPANAVPAEDSAAVSKSKKKKNAREVVVHEFERTTKFPTFLKTTVAAPGTKPELEFVEGKGWVDEAGVVVEPVKARPVTRSRAPIFKKKVPVPESSSSSSSSGTDDSDEEDASDAESTSTSPVPKTAGKGKAAQTTDSEPSSPQSDTPRPKSSDSPKNLSIRIPPATPAKDGKVHPLEALYKRPAPADGTTTTAAEPEQTSEKPFSFFANNDDDASASEGEAAPAPAEEQDVPKTQQVLMMTPFTRRDIETRGIRSAAPTPDTAHPSRRFKPWDDDAAADDIAEDGEEDEDMAVGEESPSGKATRTVAGEGGEATSDFQKWFWENRGDINRSWKKRRKQAGKEKRYRENRARMARAI